MVRVVDIEVGLKKLVRSGNGAELAIADVIWIPEVPSGGGDVLGHIIVACLAGRRLQCYKLDLRARDGLPANSWDVARFVNLLEDLKII